MRRRRLWTMCVMMWDATLLHTPSQHASIHHTHVISMSALQQLSIYALYHDTGASRRHTHTHTSMTGNEKKAEAK